MTSIYNFISGPLLWAAFLVCIAGIAWRIVQAVLVARKKDPVVFEYMSAPHAARSIFHWIIPFGSLNMKLRPVMTVVSFLFHIGAIVAPLFLFAHVMLFREAWGFGWPTLPDTLADVLTLVVLGSLVFLLVRRITVPQVRYLTTPMDFVLLGVVAAPFVTGFWAYHLLPGSTVVGILHILSGEIMLVAIPFTRLSHMIFFPFTRAYMGSEFGSIRHAQDW